MTRRPDETRFANLRSGDMAQCKEPEPCRLGLRLMFGLALAFATGCGLALTAFGDVPPHYEAPRGYDICKTKGC